MRVTSSDYCDDFRMYAIPGRYATDKLWCVSIIRKRHSWTQELLMRWGRVLWCDLGRLETCGDIAMLNVAGSKRERARVPSDVDLFCCCSFAQFLARFETWRELGRDLDGLTRFWIMRNPRDAIVEFEDAEPANFDALPAREAVAHSLENHLYGNFQIFRDELRVTFHESFDQLGLRHCGFSL